MGLSVDINLAQKQKLVVTQTLREAIELLQLSSIELMDRIEQEIEENPVLELRSGEGEEGDENRSDTPGSSAETEQQEAGEQKEEEPDIDLQSLFEDSSDAGYQGSTITRDPDSKQQFIEGALQRVQTFHENLLSQLSLATYNDEDYQVGEIIISCLNDDGYFKEDIAKLNEGNPVPGRNEDDFRRILDLIKTFDPVGVAASNLQECLLIQLQEHTDPVGAIAREIVANHLDLLERHRFKQIATKLGVSQSQVQEATHLIASLEPRPGRQFGDARVEYVIPDIIVREQDGEFIIIINDEWIPRLGVSRYYRKMLQRKNLSKKVKNYISDKFNSAQWLLKSISQRRSTLLAVTEAILEEQMDFFKTGPGSLKPLTLKDIADRINMHESTVSRVTSNKYVQTPWGLFSLKYFFSSSIRKTNGQLESSRSVKELIKKIIESEGKDGVSVYSDQDIVGILNNKGIKIARRTVAKYRKMLKILPSSRRYAKK